MITQIADFGLSTLTPNDTAMKTRAGTRQYLAPELLTVDEKEYTRSVDLWSLGVIMYKW